MKILYWLFPQIEVCNANKKIKTKIDCLQEYEKCNEIEIKNKLEDEIKNLDNRNVQELLKEEMEAKIIIEDKAKSFLTIISFMGIIFAVFSLVVTNVSSFSFGELMLLLFLLFVCLLYLIFSVFDVFYILSEINRVFKPSFNEKNVELEIKKCILLNRYQNLLRTNYLNVIYSNLKNFFIVLSLFFVFYGIFTLGYKYKDCNNLKLPSVQSTSLDDSI
jgi:hypothetical protein